MATAGESSPLPTRCPASVPVAPALHAALCALADGSPLATDPNITLVMRLLPQRVEAARAQHGTPLHSHNGRNVIQDAMRALVDAMMYAMQAQLEARDLGPLQDLTLVLLGLIKAATGARGFPGLSPSVQEAVDQRACSPASDMLVDATWSDVPSPFPSPAPAPARVHLSELEAARARRPPRVCTTCFK